MFEASGSHSIWLGLLDLLKLLMSSPGDKLLLEGRAKHHMWRIGVNEQKLQGTARFSAGLVGRMRVGRDSVCRAHMSPHDLATIISNSGVLDLCVYTRP